MATVFSPTHGEVALVNQIFATRDSYKFGVITGEVAVDIFGGANLSTTALSQIWRIADADNQGFLTRKGVSVAVRLLGWAQKGEAISEELVNIPGPLPVIDGFSSSAEFPRAVSPSPKSPGTPRLSPPLTGQHKTKFAQYFSKCNPVNGVLSGEKACEVFVKSKLSDKQLSQIWDLSDTQKRGSLDVADFTVAMYLIQASMSGQLTFIPTTLPPGLYEMASDQTLPGNTVPLQQQFTGPVAQNETLFFSPEGAFSAFTAPRSRLAWDVTPTEKASAEKYFDGLDTLKRGYIESDVVVPFMLESKDSKLPAADLASIWSLADLNNDGRLTRDGFSVAFHLIQGKHSGKDAMPQTTVEAGFPPMAAVDAATETRSANPFSPVPAKDSSPFPASTPPFVATLEPQKVATLSDFDKAFAATPEPQKVATLSDFDKAFSDFPGTTSTTAWNNLSFDDAFKDQFNSTKAEPSTSLPGISVYSSGSSAEIPTSLPASSMPPSMRTVTTPTTSPFQQPPSDSLNDLFREDSRVAFQPQSAISAPHTQGQSTFGFSRCQPSSSSDARAAHGASPFQMLPPESWSTPPLQVTRDRTPGSNDLPSLLPGMNDRPRRVSEEDDDTEGSREHHAKLVTPDTSSEKEVARLGHERITDLERQLSEMLTAQTERDRHIAQLTDQLAQKSALLEQAEANAAEAMKHARLELRELQANLDDLMLSRDEHLGALEQAQSALQKATSRAAGADERSQPPCEHETGLVEVRAELEGKKSELEAVRLRLTDAENRCAKSKAEADTLRAGTQAAAGLVNMDVDRVMRKLMERVRAVEAEMASLRGNEKSIESMECRNEG